MSSLPLHVFMAYARKDDAYLKELKKHFAILERDKKVKLWSDNDIEAGANWNQNIKNALHKADIILLLLSADALASDYFYQNELPKALEKHRNQEAKLIPILVRACTWEMTPLKDIGDCLFPRDKQPISGKPNQDSIYENIVSYINQLLPELNRKKAAIEKDRAEKSKLDAELKKAKADLKSAQTAANSNATRINEIEQKMKDLQTELREKQSKKYDLDRSARDLEGKVQTLEWQFKQNANSTYRFI